MLADANEEKTIQVAIVRDEVTMSQYRCYGVQADPPHHRADFGSGGHCSNCDSHGVSSPVMQLARQNRVAFAYRCGQPMGQRTVRRLLIRICSCCAAVDLGFDPTSLHRLCRRPSRPLASTAHVSSEVAEKQRLVEELVRQREEAEGKLRAAREQLEGIRAERTTATGEAASEEPRSAALMRAPRARGGAALRLDGGRTHPADPREP